MTESENGPDESNDQIRDSRTRVLARLLRSYYLRMNRDGDQNENGNGSDDETQQRPQSRIGISRRFELEGDNSAGRLSRWNSEISINTMTRLNNRLNNTIVEEPEEADYQ